MWKLLSNSNEDWTYLLMSTDNQYILWKTPPTISGKLIGFLQKYDLSINISSLGSVVTLSSSLSPPMLQGNDSKHQRAC